MRILTALFAATLLALGVAGTAQASPYSKNHDIRAYSVNPRCATNGDTIYRLRLVNHTDRSRVFTVREDAGLSGGQVGMTGHTAVTWRLRVTTGETRRVAVVYRGEVLTYRSRLVDVC